MSDSKTRRPGADSTGRSEVLVDQVRRRYGSIARGDSSGCGTPTAGEGCCSTVEREVSGRIGYDASAIESVPADANLGLGCGAPIEALDLRAGETVVDLGSGGGLDAFLAAQRVGPSGQVIGVDMTPEMIAKARRSAERGGYTNVEFREGRLEALPVDDATVDAITSNCVINLVPDKAAVFREVARVLKPGGRIVVSDIVLDGELPGEVAEDVLAYVGCVSGAVERSRYFETLRAAGLGQIEVLKDVDYLATVGDCIPDEAKQLMTENGMTRADLEGVVRSITYRARR